MKVEATRTTVTSNLPPSIAADKWQVVRVARYHHGSRTGDGSQLRGIAFCVLSSLARLDGARLRGVLPMGKSPLRGGAKRFSVLNLERHMALGTLLFGRAIYEGVGLPPILALDCASAPYRTTTSSAVIDIGIFAQYCPLTYIHFIYLSVYIYTLPYRQDGDELHE